VARVEVVDTPALTLFIYAKKDGRQPCPSSKLEDGDQGGRLAAKSPSPKWTSDGTKLHGKLQIAFRWSAHVKSRRQAGRRAGAENVLTVG
jgi:hypothetical protein